MATGKANRKQSTVKLTPAKKGTPISVDEFLKLKQPKGDLILDVEGQAVGVTSLERVYWPDEKITKFELLCYYIHVSSLIMPFLKNRPAILQRWPRGINAPMFFQQDWKTAPAFV
ncbi:MAG: hypothetical protein M3539_10275, partial [Acidobacteriota bacterium]|nr:hypothetical protein [Acidobacteriota bacterium]